MEEEKEMKEKEKKEKEKREGEGGGWAPSTWDSLLFQRPARNGTLGTRPTHTRTTTKKRKKEKKKKEKKKEKKKKKKKKRGKIPSLFLFSLSLSLSLLLLSLLLFCVCVCVCVVVVLWGEKNSKMFRTTRNKRGEKITPTARYYIFFLSSHPTINNNQFKFNSVSNSVSIFRACCVGPRRSLNCDFFFFFFFFFPSWLKSRNETDN